MLFPMERKRFITLVAAFAFLTVGVMIAFQVGQRRSTSSSKSSAKPRRQFIPALKRAKDSKTDVRVFPNKGRAPTSADLPKGSTRSVRKEANRGKPQDARPSPAEGVGNSSAIGAGDSPTVVASKQLASQALGAVSPEDGVAMLQARLATLDNLEGASRLYAALGTLYSQTSPLDTGPAEDALAFAARLASTSEERHDAAYRLASMHMMRGDAQGAVEAAAAALEEDTALTAAGLQLRVMEGSLYEQSGETFQAEETYRKAIAAFEAGASKPSKEVLNVYRQACLSLARLLRKAGRVDEAETIVRNFKQKVSRM